MRDLIKIFKALSDSNRIRILKMLQIRPLCVCEITAVLNLATSTVSKHLSILREVDLIYDIKEGKWVNYYFNKKSNDLYIKDILPLLKEWLPQDSLVKEDMLKVSKVDRTILCKS
jgi:ArsR family transcriptional regulator, arsenate/arsenite/antimonite-responsive transcriptional repressor